MVDLDYTVIVLNALFRQYVSSETLCSERLTICS